MVAWGSRRSRRIGLAVVALLQVVSTALAAHEPLRIMQHQYVVDTSAQTVHFELWFDRAPDFLTVDEFGRPRDAFAYYFDSDGNVGTGQYSTLGPLAYGADVQLTSSQVHLNGLLWMRDLYGMPPAGPWRDATPFTVLDTTLQFTASFSALRFAGGSHLLGFVDTYQYGATTGQQQPFGPPIPAPNATLLALCAMAVLAAARLGRRA
jgi:hypothetical protein